MIALLLALLQGMTAVPVPDAGPGSLTGLGPPGVERPEWSEMTWQGDTVLAPIGAHMQLCAYAQSRFGPLTAKSAPECPDPPKLQQAWFVIQHNFIVWTIVVTVLFSAFIWWRERDDERPSQGR